MAKRRRSSGRARTRRKSGFFTTVLIVLLVLAVLAGAYYYFFIYKKRVPDAENGGGGEGSATAQTGKLSIHFLELGNKYAGDCIFIQTGDTEVLIDGGSREQSADTIERYVKNYCRDGVLEYVIVTHADQDHIAAFAGNKTYPSLFERFECKTIVDFPLTNKTTQVYNRYVSAREAEVKAGAVHYTALQCYRNEDGAQRSYSLSQGVEMTFLYNYFYENKSGDENNYSVCMELSHGQDHYLFTGDLEEEGEEKLVDYNDLPHCKLYKAGHHGSNTSSGEKLLAAIRPEYVCVCCCAGAPEYTQNADNTFPTRAMLERVMKYTEQIFVTSMATGVDLENKEWEYAPLNGNIVVEADGENFTVTGSNHSTPLPETAWFAENRAQ